MKKYIVAFSLLAGCTHKVDRWPSNMPITEAVQVNSPGLHMQLPVNRFYGFSRDIISIPINVSEGSSSSPLEYNINFELLMKSEQKSEFLMNVRSRSKDELAGKSHWLNGYTVDGLESKKPLSSSGNIRIQRGLPIQKILRWEISDDLLPGSYKARISVTDDNGKQILEEYVEIGVHQGLKYFATLNGNSLTVRDVFGMAVEPVDILLIQHGNDGRVSRAIPLESSKSGVIDVEPRFNIRRGDILRARVVNGPPVDISIDTSAK